MKNNEIKSFVLKQINMLKQQNESVAENNLKASHFAN